jgi:hypothetical protein
MRLRGCGARNERRKHAVSALAVAGSLGGGSIEKSCLGVGRVHSNDLH